MKNILRKREVFIPLCFLAFIWGIKLSEILFKIKVTSFGIYPRSFSGLFGIISFPLIHGDLNHLYSNSVPLFLLAYGILFFYEKSSVKVLLLVYFVPGILVWLFGREAYHIGASGMVYGMAAFLFFSGIIRRDRRAITLALLVTFLYGGLVWGVLPLEDKISWEGHLFGGITGVLCAIVFRKKDPYYKYEWEKEEEKTPREKLEVSWDKGYPFDEDE